MGRLYPASAPEKDRRVARRGARCAPSPSPRWPLRRPDAPCAALCAAGRVNGRLFAGERTQGKLGPLKQRTANSSEQQRTAIAIRSNADPLVHLLACSPIETRRTANSKNA